MAAGCLRFFALTILGSVTAMATVRAPAAANKLLVIGGNGFVGREVCREAVRKGFLVTSLSRRGAPSELDSLLSKVDWRASRSRLT
jgi:hypothetical protein